MLMAALQYVTEEDYNALIIRRTLEDLDMPNAIMDRAKQWLLPLEDSGLVTWKEQKKRFLFESGATLTFRYLKHDNDLNSYQGAELQFVGFDELTQFPENQYNYLHSRLRKLDDSNIPLRMRAGTNPGGRGHDWVKRKFIDDESELPFIASAYTDNNYLNQVEYSNQLNKLDELTRQQLKYGDWDAVITNGLLINRNKLSQNLISITNDFHPVFSTIGIDPASSGSDNFSVSLLSYFTNDKLVVMDMLSTPDNSMIEEQVRNFIIKNQKYNIVLINFEREPGSRSEDALKYWKTILNDLIPMNSIIDTPASTTGSKYNRARPHANLVKEDKLFFNKALLLDNNIDDIPLNKLFNQYVYVHPNKEIMANYSSPDELDSLSYAYLAMNQLLTNSTKITIGNHIGV